jgi:hypothetical protein
MPENSNVELAHKLSEQEQAERRLERWHELVEILEVVILAVVAIATAWSGYQAAKWDGRQTVLYGQANRDRFAASADATFGGQRLLADSSMFSGWLQARATGDAQLQDLYVRRFSPEYRTAFDAWLGTNPFTNLQAPAGPGFMTEYHNPSMDEATRLNEQANATFDEGTHAGERAEDYVRDTVLFASVLFLVAVAQRFKDRAVRIGANAIAVAVLVYVLTAVVTLPRI